METAPDPCPGEYAILDFVQGKLADSDARTLEAHLDRCAECRRVVSELAGSSLVRSTAAGSRGTPTQATTEVGTGASTSAAPVDELRAGTRVGRFTILELCGVGGMGVVYTAHDPDLDRRVAIKLLRAAPASEASEGRSRLMREAQAMARLSHPNVISVYEVGTYEDLVFVAMEFVDGGTLTNWLRRERRGWREVLERFVRAGRGLAAAHAAGLVHRDFKPDNVLCGRDGRVRVTDFGLARVAAHDVPRAPQSPLEISGDAALIETLTRTGALLGTPAYMSPEQYEGRAATALGDQFSFCVALYEGLYGERPFQGRTIRELREAVTDGRVREPPSDTRVPAWLRRIVLRGLSVNPAARYPSMDALIADLERDPAAKRRWLVYGGAAAVAVVSLGVALWFSLRDPSHVCRGAEDRLTGVWDRGRKRAIESAFVKTDKPYAKSAWTAVQRAIDRYTTEWVAMRTEACEATRVHGEQSDATLALRMACLDRRLANVDELARVFERADANVLEHAVRAVDGLPRLSECADAAALISLAPRPRSPDAKRQIDEIERGLAEARALFAAAEFAKGRPLAEAQMKAATELGWKPLIAQTTMLVAQYLHRMGEYAAAERAYYEAAFAAQAGRDDRTATEALIELYYNKATRQSDAGEESERLLKLAGAMLERLGNDDPLTARLLDARAQAMENLGNYEEGMKLTLQSKAIYERLYPAEDHHHVPWMMTLGGVYFRLGRYADAAETYRRCVELNEASLGPDHPDVATALNMLASSTDAAGKWSESLPAFERAARIQERSLGPDHPHLGTTLHNHAITLDQLGRHDEALALELRVLEIFERSYGKDHPRIASALGTTANIYMSKDDYASARPLLERGLSIVERTYGPEHRDTAMMLVALASCDQGQGRSVDAIARYLRALAIEEKVMGPNHPHVAVTLSNLGELYVQMKQWEKAADAFRRALEIDETQLGPDHPGVSYDLSGLGHAYVALGQADKAIPLLERAVAIRERGHNPYQLADARFRLANALVAGGGDRKRARALATQARATFVADPAAKQDVVKVDDWLKKLR